MFHANQWGTVCDDGFTDAAARVVCHSLGFGYIGRKVDVNYYGVGVGVIWLNNVNCSGTEQYISECSHGDWGDHDCTHHEDIAISCTGNTPAANVSDSTTVTPVRLVGGSGSTGRLEILHNGVWGTVCGDTFTAVEVRVLCSMLKLGPGTEIDNIKYMTDHGTIWLDDVRCSGRETDIAECSHNGWGVHNCQHEKDVAISCTHTRIGVRLNGGRDPREGRLEVFHNGTWTKVCDRLYYATALVVCNMLGFGYTGRPTSVSTVRHQYGPDRGQIWFDSVWCTGTEESIMECDHNGWTTRRCSSGNNQQTMSCLPDDAVALFGGGSPCEGRLEVYHNGIWGTVCADRFTEATAKVVCHSLGFGYNGQTMSVGMYGVGKGMVWLDGVHCDGTEIHIGECSHREWGTHNCTHNEDVAISCVGGLPVPTSTTSKPSPTSKSFPASTVSSTTQARGDSHHDAPVTTHLRLDIIGAVVLLICVLIFCVVSVIAFWVFKIVEPACRKPRRECTEAVAMIPMRVTASTADGQNDDHEGEVVLMRYESLASDTRTTQNNAYSDLQQSSAPAAAAAAGGGAVGCTGIGNISCEL